MKADDHQTTIAAVATPVGAGGIAIVRVSGERSDSVAKRLIRPQGDLLNRRMAYGHVVDPVDGRVIDEVLYCYMAGPATYTRENTLEIYCHGGYLSAKRVLEAVLACGVEMAGPGEFTRRAFMSGRIDLSQAEAVAELIGARSDTEADLALSQLAGGLRDRVQDVEQALIREMAVLEVAIDYPEEEQEIVNAPAASDRLQGMALKPLMDLLAAYDHGRVYREGIRVAIVGRPNVGKSSLMNALVRAEKAIVNPMPGTTRDVIEAEAAWHGLPMTLIDTAGLETPPGDDVEAEGQRRARQRLEQADLVLIVIDRSRPLSDEDRRIRDLVPPGRGLIVLNKTDLPDALTDPDGGKGLDGGNVVPVSAKSGFGVEDLREAVFRMVTESGGKTGRVPEMVPNLRHKQALENAIEPIRRAADGLRTGIPPELTALEIRLALEQLGLITGRTATADLLDEIFSRFCLGK